MLSVRDGFVTIASYTLIKQMEEIECFAYMAMRWVMKSILSTLVVIMLALALAAVLVYAGRLTHKVFPYLFHGSGTVVARETVSSKVALKVKCYDDERRVLQRETNRKSNQDFIILIKRIFFL
jgi:hypothetical protein